MKRLLMIFLLLPMMAAGSVQQYPSGLLRTFDAEQGEGKFLSEEEASRAFIAAHFDVSGFEWRQMRRIEDRTHVHRSYQLYYRNVEVLDHFLKLHYSKKGFLQYASSSWKFPFSLSALPAVDSRSLRQARGRLEAFYQPRNTPAKGEVAFRPVIWVDEKTAEARSAYAVRARGPLGNRYEVVDEQTGVILSRRRILRDVVSNKVYLTHPDRGVPVSQTLPDLSDSATTLEDASGYIHVQREQNPNSAVRKEVVPQTLYADDGSFSDLTGGDAGTLYAHDCVSGDCPNQSFDAVNVYYHVKHYRDQVESYFSELGVVSGLDLDPLDVVVNTMSIDTTGTQGGTDEANNAFYTSGFRGIDGEIKTGLFFLRPATATAASTAELCDQSGDVEFFALSREAIVIVHEYQHYITDRITELVAGTLSDPNVGDSLHEGYSDYFGASEVSRVAGEDITVIGEYAFKNCVPIQRDIAQIKVFTNEVADTPAEDFSDPHTGGWSWASGLWALRESLGAETVDLIAYKSLFLMPTEPGFLDAVEALVRADQAIHDGANVSAIRAMFYETVKFAGGATNVFRDPSTGVIEVGFRSCLSVPMASGASGAAGLLGIVWLMGTLWVGRRLR